MAAVWLNRAGGLVDAALAAVPADDRGLLLGDGLFETARIYQGRLPLLDRHLARLAASAAALGFGPLPAGLAEAAAAVVAENSVGDGALRITLTRGPGPRGLAPPAAPDPAVLITAQPWSPPAPGTAWALALTDMRVSPAAPTARHKTTSALDKVMARTAAARAGADDALLLNTAGHLAEAASANLFWVRGGRLETPAVECGCLPGVIRSLVLESGLPVSTGAFGPEALAEASEVFVTNALVEVLPVRAVLGLPGGPGLTWPAPGPVTRQVSAAVRHRIGSP